MLNFIAFLWLSLDNHKNHKAKAIGIEDKSDWNWLGNEKRICVKSEIHSSKVESMTCFCCADGISAVEVYITLYWIYHVNFFIWVWICMKIHIVIMDNPDDFWSISKCGLGTLWLCSGIYGHHVTVSPSMVKCHHLTHSTLKHCHCNAFRSYGSLCEIGYTYKNLPANYSRAVS